MGEALHTVRLIEMLSGRLDSIIPNERWLARCGLKRTPALKSAEWSSDD